jgi:hypothetical protein
MSMAQFQAFMAITTIFIKFDMPQSGTILMVKSTV